MFHFNFSLVVVMKRKVKVPNFVAYYSYKRHGAVAEHCASATLSLWKIKIVMMYGSQEVQLHAFT